MGEPYSYMVDPNDESNMVGFCMDVVMEGSGCEEGRMRDIEFCKGEGFCLTNEDGTMDEDWDCL